MNKPQRIAVNKFNKFKDKDYFINPISELDCEIIIELGQVLKKAGADDVFEILRSYKELADSEIRDRLLEWNTSNSKFGIKGLINKAADKALNGEDEDEFENPHKTLLSVGDFKLYLGDLYGFKLEDSERNGIEYHNIILNPTPENAKKVPIYANEVVEFEDYENRKECIQKIEEAMLNCGMKIIDLT